jgi:hypothetical protein
MSYSIAVMGNSGRGKSTSLRNLDFKKTFIIDSDRKGMPWKGWRKQYNKENKNYIQTSEVPVIETCLDKINRDKEFKHIECIVIDTVNAVMLDSEMRRIKEKGFEKWSELAQDAYSIISLCNGLRYDLYSVCFFHLDDTGEGEKHSYRIKTNGRKLEKIQLETKFPIVLLADSEGDNFYFETKCNFSTTKTPMGLFTEPRIPNDINLVIQTCKKYEMDELEGLEVR